MNTTFEFVNFVEFRHNWYHWSPLNALFPNELLLFVKPQIINSLEDIYKQLS